MNKYIGETSYLFGANETYIADMYERYLTQPGTVGDDWVSFFESLDDDVLSVLDDVKNPAKKSKVVGVKKKRGLSSYLLNEKYSKNNLSEMLGVIASGESYGELGKNSAMDTARALLLVRAYRLFGHFKANLDPLEMRKRQGVKELDPVTYGFSPDEDMDKEIYLNYQFGLETATLRELIRKCESIYCGNIAYEYLNMSSTDEKNWLRDRIEQGDKKKDGLTSEEKITFFQSLLKADGFESFLDKKHRGAKRFGLDGGESLIPLVETLLMEGTSYGLESMVIGMAHRGRLNVLANILNKPYRAIFNEFMGGGANPDDLNVSGDVKYHLGTSEERTLPGGKKVHISLLPNPSHLEAVNTVVLGSVRARQDARNDKNREKVMGLLIHGDAAFIGQGIVAETFLLSQLDGYKTGGTIHLVHNNQIGFTTKPDDSRSSPYCSDMAKVVDAPVIHVNGDDIDACVKAARIAVEYRMKFKKDIVIDMWCYRRNGHNEADEPMFTQPLMYKKIAEKERAIDIYKKQLIREGVACEDEIEELKESFKSHLEKAYTKAYDYKPLKANWLEKNWEGLKRADGADNKRRGSTDVDIKMLESIMDDLTKIPDEHNVHPKIVKRAKQQRKMFFEEGKIDWSMAEALAFGTLVKEGTAIRLSGEDCRRGTFSHRHSVWVDQKNEKDYVPINNIKDSKPLFEVLDSPLSEYGLLGYEYGYGLSAPNALVIWEAQFGDFANGAQIMIDQFISSSETKWLRMNGLVMLLPHGYEGQGPEHSSARIERYLQMSAEDNWQVCNITSPANLFHAFRRQVRRDFRKPLIIASPKSLLRNKYCVSSIKDIAKGSYFHRWHDDPTSHKLLSYDKIKRVIICTGKVSYDLISKRNKERIKDIVIVRLEQLYPLPKVDFIEEMTKFKNAEFVWCQEEPENSGAWEFLSRKIENLLEKTGNKNTRLSYVGRPESASPATGSLRQHNIQQEKLINEALNLKGEK